MNVGLSIPSLIGLDLAAAVLLMTLCWACARRIDNYSIVDAVWALAFAILAPLDAALADGFPARKMLIAVMFAFWGGRLGLHLAKRIFGHLEIEDGRYVKLRADYGTRVASRFFVFFQYQALSVVLLLGPVFVTVGNREPELNPLEFFGAMIWLIGWVGESIADLQLAHFRRDPSQKGKVCDRGLWNYSRHPNYFFEFIIWCGYGVFAMGSPGGWIALYAPLIMFFLLTRVTGVPLAEEQSLKSRGELYRAYQRRVSRFFPMPPRCE